MKTFATFKNWIKVNAEILALVLVCVGALCLSVGLLALLPCGLSVAGGVVSLVGLFGSLGGLVVGCVC